MKQAGKAARTTGERMTLQAYAAHRGCSLAAVHKAIGRHVLEASVRREGRAWSIDPELADREWATQTQPAKQRGRAAERAKADRGKVRRAAAGDGAEAPPGVLAAPSPDGGDAGSGHPAGASGEAPRPPKRRKRPRHEPEGEGAAAPARPPAGGPGESGGAEGREEEEAPEEGELAGVTESELKALLVQHRGEVAFVQAIELEVRARLRLIELRRKRKELMDVARAERLWFVQCRAIRDKILQLAPKIRDRVIGLEDPVQVELIVEEMLIGVLSELASEGASPIREDRDGRD